MAELVKLWTGINRFYRRWRKEKAMIDAIREILSKDHHVDGHYACHLCEDCQEAVLREIMKTIEAKPKKMNSKAYCWNCKKDIDCECMDATCRVCGAPYDKKRCKEFNFVPRKEK